MALNAIAEAIVRVVANVVIGRAIGKLIGVLFVGFYWLGWVVLRTVTFGRYPPPQTERHNREFVAMVAFAMLLAGVTFYYSGSFA
jgi:hypothetical protein